MSFNVAILGAGPSGQIQLRTFNQHLKTFLQEEQYQPAQECA
ncbi:MULTISPECIES: hypothetical protein [Oceanisphaera]|uniref:Uncharacterized protein n=1 Tax=Oceanisphaera ostreae TaxID=914151 RepID=A0ABW3KEJ8_9GAMM